MSPFSSPIDTNAGQLASVPVTIQNRKSSDSFFEKRSRSVHQRARRNRCVPGGAACGEEPSASRESEVGLEVYRRGTRDSRRAGQHRSDGGIRPFDMHCGNPNRSCIDGRRDHDRADATDENDDIVEIVVIPVAAQPRGVRGISVGARREPDEQDGDGQAENASDASHAV
jgi:hypothetical protein